MFKEATMHQFSSRYSTVLNREAVRSFNPLKSKLFTSPWAVRRWSILFQSILHRSLTKSLLFREDEEFFNCTLDLLGRYTYSSKTGNFFEFMPLEKYLNIYIEGYLRSGIVIILENKVRRLLDQFI